MIARPWAAAACILVSKRPKEGYRILFEKRSSGSRFMPNYYVFPGGKYHSSDYSSHWLKVLPQLAKRRQWPLYITAIRETFEECGILLGCDEKVQQPNNTAFQDARVRVIDDPAAFTPTLLEKLGVSLNLPQLHPWHRFCGPETAKTRFDTMFYLTISSIDPDFVSGDQFEVIETTWLSPTEALEKFKTGLLQLAPPQWYILHELEKFTTVEALEKEIQQRKYPLLYRPVSGFNDTAFFLPGDENHDTYRGQAGDRHRFVTTSRWETIELQNNLSRQPVDSFATTPDAVLS